MSSFGSFACNEIVEGRKSNQTTDYMVWSTRVSHATSHATTKLKFNLASRQSVNVIHTSANIRSLLFRIGNWYLTMAENTHRLGYTQIRELCHIWVQLHCLAIMKESLSPKQHLHTENISKSTHACTDVSLQCRPMYLIKLVTIWLE